MSKKRKAKKKAKTAMAETAFVTIAPQPAPEGKRRTTAVDRVRRAERLVERWRRSAERNGRIAERAKAAGNEDRHALADKRATAALHHLAKAMKRLARYKPIAALQRAVERNAAAGILDRAIEAVRPQKARKAKPRAADRNQPPRVADTVLQLYRRGHIDSRQRQAADIYREAFDAVQANGMSGTLNPDKTGGASGAGKSPPEHVLQAAELLNAAARSLGKRDGMVVAEVVGHGRSIEDLGRQLYAPPGGHASKDKLAFVGTRLREGLAVLAELWIPERQGGRQIRTDRQPGAKPVAGETSAIAPARTAHAGHGPVRYSGKATRH